MKHLGDITKINGAEIPTVDCITGGSPCQDLSVAGKRAGLSGERSGLFMEQLRIVKEMRKRDQEENGNSIALPYWFRLLRRISAVYDRPATLGSLFDGIGGFPLCWERCNGEGTAIWASEIEEFPIAVTKRHFPERGDAE